MLLLLEPPEGDGEDVGVVVGVTVGVVVGVTVETVKQVESQMIVRNYKGFLNN